MVPLPLNDCLEQVVLAGLSNVYTHYITTPEEYTAQRYEGASTIFGPHTFQAYYQKYSSLVKALVTGQYGEKFSFYGKSVMIWL